MTTYEAVVEDVKQEFLIATSTAKVTNQPTNYFNQ